MKCILFKRRLTDSTAAPATPGLDAPGWWNASFAVATRRMSSAYVRDKSDCHFRQKATEYDRESGITQLSCIDFVTIRYNPSSTSSESNRPRTMQYPSAANAAASAGLAIDI